MRIRPATMVPASNTSTRPWRGLLQRLGVQYHRYSLTLDRRGVSSVSNSQGSKPVLVRGKACAAAAGPCRQAFTRRTAVQGSNTSARTPPSRNCNVGRRRPDQGRRSADGSRRSQSLGPGTPNCTVGHQCVNRTRATVAAAVRAHPLQTPPQPADFRPAISYCSGRDESGRSSRARDAPALGPTESAAPPGEMKRDEDRT